MSVHSERTSQKFEALNNLCFALRGLTMFSDYEIPLSKLPELNFKVYNCSWTRCDFCRGINMTVRISPRVKTWFVKETATAPYVPYLFVAHSKCNFALHRYPSVHPRVSTPKYCGFSKMPFWFSLQKLYSTCIYAQAVSKEGFYIRAWAVLWKNGAVMQNSLCVRTMQ